MIFTSIILVLLITMQNVNAYIIGPNVMNWEDAEAYCVLQGSNLATISNDVDRDAAKALCSANDENSGRGCWIGLYEETMNVWKWADGSALGYGFDANSLPTTGVNPWHSGEPNNHGGQPEDCIHLFDSLGPFNWNDAICNDNNLPLCNDPVPRYFYGGICPSLGGCIAICEDQGTTLATVDNAADQEEFVASMRDEGQYADNRRYVIGLHDNITEGVWLWDDGTPCSNGNLCIDYWKAGEPNNQNDEDCMEIWFNENGANIFANDLPCSFNIANRYHAVCNAIPEPDDYVVDGPLDCQAAQEYCKNTYGTQLATIRTDEDRTNAINALTDAGQEYGWIGLYSDDVETKWQFRSGDECPSESAYKCVDFWLESFKDGGANRPRCIGPSENGYGCAVFYRDDNGVNNDKDVNDPIPFLCDI